MKIKFTLTYFFVVLCISPIFSQGNSHGGAGGGTGHGIRSFNLTSDNYEIISKDIDLTKTSDFYLINSSDDIVAESSIVNGIDPLEVYIDILNKGSYTAIYKEKNGNIVNIITFEVE